MSSCEEEQEMEAEALTAIFDTHFQPEPNSCYPNQKWTVTLYPEQASDENELRALNHVAIELYFHLPAEYPETATPEISIRIKKGLCEDPHGVELQKLAQEEAEANLGIPAVFAIAEKCREWLVEHNRPGLDDTSAYATMMRQQHQAETDKQKRERAAAFEAQAKREEMTVAELEELAVRKRRAEGTPCNKENFEAWAAKFATEMAAQTKKLGDNNDYDDVDERGEPVAVSANKASKSAAAGKGGVAAPLSEKKLTGYDYFCGKSTNLEALEAAAEQAEMQEDDDGEDDEDEELQEDGGVVAQVNNKDLFEDDVDLDDLDFEDDDDDGDDDDENEKDEPDI